MAHTLFENKVLENKVKNQLDTKLDVQPFFTVDRSLTEAAGRKKVINTYSFTKGAVRDVAQGEGNQSADDIEVGFTAKEYIVKYTQGHMQWFDEQAEQDPMLLDVGVSAQSTLMYNDTIKKFYTALGTAELTMEYPKAGITKNTVIDALAKFPEGEEGLNMFINPDQKAQLRKSLGEELKYVEDFARTGYIGHVMGVPIHESKAVPAKTAFIASKEAVTLFVKKDVSSETSREANLRKNDMYFRRENVMALTDATRALKLTEAA